MPTKKPPTAAPTDGRGRPIRTVRVDLNLDDYPPDTHAIMRINPPMRTFDALGGDNRGALSHLIVSWNLVDDDGSPLQIDETLSGATDDELAALLTGWYEKIKAKTAVPKP